MFIDIVIFYCFERGLSVQMCKGVSQCRHFMYNLKLKIFEIIPNSEEIINFHLMFDFNTLLIKTGIFSFDKLSCLSAVLFGWQYAKIKFFSVSRKIFASHPCISFSKKIISETVYGPLFTYSIHCIQVYNKEMQLDIQTKNLICSYFYMINDTAIETVIQNTVKDSHISLWFLGVFWSKHIRGCTISCEGF